MNGPRVCVVGDDGLAETVGELGGEPAVGPPAEAGTVDAAVAVGSSSAVDLARAGVGAPVLVVDAEGLPAVPREQVDAALERLLGGSAPAGAETESHPVVSATVDGSGSGADDLPPAVYDVALMAAEPARISEFSVRYGDATVARFRADGVVASTPAGSVGYNRAADGPVVAPGPDVVSVVPVAPFATRTDRWVLPVDDVALAVERDETLVEVLVDGRPEREVAAGEPIELTRVGDLAVVLDPACESVL